MAATVLPLCSSSSIAEDPLSGPWEESNCSAELDVLWDDADLAERYLVCSQFEKAILLSSTLLQKLVVIWESSEQSMHNGTNDDEIEGLMEAAGMVLIQGNAESGRARLIFTNLESIFGCSAKIPSSVLLTGLCLQVSAGLFSEAQLIVKTFLKHWAYEEIDQQFCTYKPESGHDHKIFQLGSERYMEIMNVYCVQVLAKGLCRIDLAMQWVNEAGIPAEMKQEMHEKLEKLSLNGSRSEESVLVNDGNAVLSRSPNTNEKNDLWVTEYMEAKSGPAAAKQVTEELDSRFCLKSIFLLTPLINILSSWTGRFMSYSDCGSKWKSMLAVVSRKKIPFGGAAAVFITIAIYKQRFQIFRFFGGLNKGLRHVLKALFISVYDFWQLAFSVQLNPLAAVQPLPSTHYRM